MSSIVICGIVILPTTLLSRGVVVVQDERIVAVGRAGEVAVPLDAQIIDVDDGYISPGSVDIHTHGGAGNDFMDGTDRLWI